MEENIKSLGPFTNRQRGWFTKYDGVELKKNKLLQIKLIVSNK